MSFFRVQLGVVSRSKGGSALRRSVYQRCTTSEDGQFDFSHKEHEYAGHEVLLPEGVLAEFQDPDFLWQQAEYMERRVDSQTARTVDIAIPDEVPEHLWHDLSRELMGFYRDHGFAVEFSIHRDAGVFRQADNTHIHGMLSTRQIGSRGFASKKDRDFEKKVMRKNGGHHMRKVTADIMNRFFQTHAIDAHVDHRKKEKREDVVTVMYDKQTVKEIRRHKEDVKEHMAMGNSIASYDGQLSRKAQEFLAAKHDHKQAITELRKAREELNEALLKLAHPDDMLSTNRVP